MSTITRTPHPLKSSVPKSSVVQAAYLITYDLSVYRLIYLIKDLVPLQLQLSYARPVMAKTEEPENYAEQHQTVEFEFTHLFARCESLSITISNISEVRQFVIKHIILLPLQSL